MAASAFAGSTQVSRVVDRTFRCTPVALGSRLRDVDVNAVPKGASEGYNPAQPRSPGYIGVDTGSYAAASEVVSIRSRRWWRFATNLSPEGVWVSTKRCAPSQAPVALSRKGLSGEAIRWSEHGTCLVRGGLLIRVRASLHEPSGWQSGPTQGGIGTVGAYSNVRTGALVVRSARTGRPVAYAELDANGKTRIWFAPDCQ